MSRFLDAKYRKLEVYTPGEQPQNRRYIKLNTNESPYPPSPGVLRAVNEKEAADLRLYSDPECRALRAAMAPLYGVAGDELYFSNGSDDILNFAFMAFGGGGVVFPAVSYGFYKVFAELHGVDYEMIPMEPDLSINPAAYRGKNRLVVIANPNAPTGLCLSLPEIEDILQSNPDNVVLIDEAYVDFGGESAVPLTKKYPNLLVVQTFSKSRSMAGARLGFAIAQRELIADLERIKYSTNPYNINRLTSAAGVAAAAENDYYMENCRRVMESRDYTTRELQRLGFTVIPSRTNFVFAKSDRIGGQELYEALKDRGILVRHFTQEDIREYNRITIGTREEMETLIKTLEELL